MATVKLYYVTFPDRDAMADVTGQLLDDHLVACVNSFPVGSVYWSDGETERRGEVGAFLKTADGAGEELQQRLEEEHPYDVPEILELEVSANRSYADWVESNTE
ncbi:MAG: divalent cation tolerance protein CutA [Candidatus Nanohaloarchaea archaeon]|nr:divalent cation tolerance protein CutA [Candidatus Nanohaloarchaea archaeon]